MEITLKPSTTKIVSTTSLNSNSDAGPNMLLDLKKSGSKSEETVNIPTKTLVAEPVIFTGGKCSSRIQVNRTECTSAVTGSVSSSEKDFHVVKIQISPNSKNTDNDDRSKCKEVPEQQHQKLMLNSDVQSVGDHTSFSKSDLSSGILIEPVQKPKVSIVSFIPRVVKTVDQFSLVNNNCKTNVSQTFLTSSSNSEDRSVLEEEINKLLPDDEEKVAVGEESSAAAAVIFNTTATTTSNEMVQKPSGDLEVSNPTYLYYMMTSGQCSPSDTLDSGTCSDMENNSGNNNSTSSSVSPPPLPKKMGSKLKMHLKAGSITSEDQSSDDQADQTVQKIHGHIRTGSFTDSEGSESSLSCDSLNSSEFARNNMLNVPLPPLPPLLSASETIAAAISFLPDSLLRDIRDRKFAGTKETNGILTNNPFTNGLKMKTTDHLPTEDQLRDRNKSCVLITQDKTDQLARTFENDKFYTFHINEKDVVSELVDRGPKIFRDDESFAGYKDIHSSTSTIRSSKGTVRGVKNRVRNGIATFLQMQQTNVKNYKEKDAGKVVLYTTSMGIVRETYAKCANIKQILRTLLVKFEERDVFMSNDYQQEIKERMQSEDIQVPQLFVEGQHIGDAANVERLNESGELRKMLKPYKSISSSYTCQVCGGYRLLPCSSCNGSKKSVHRNHFTAEFVALKCMNCDEVGLIKCYNC